MDAPLHFSENGQALPVNWHECAAFQRSAVGRSTAGNDVVATISNVPFYFILLYLQVLAFSPALCALTKTSSLLTIDQQIFEKIDS